MTIQETINNVHDSKTRRALDSLMSDFLTDDGQPKTFILNVTMADLSTSESVWVVSPYAAKIKKIYSVIDATIATANGAVTVEIDGTAVTDAAITIAYSGSGAGDVDSSTPSALNTVTAGQEIEIITSGAPTNTCITTFTLVMERT